MKKENKANKNRLVRDIRNIFEHKEEEEENYYKSLRVDNFCSINYIEHESNSDATKSKLQSHKKVYKNKDFCNILNPS